MCALELFSLDMVPTSNVAQFDDNLIKKFYGKCIGWVVISGPLSVFKGAINIHSNTEHNGLSHHRTVTYELT